MARRGDRHIRNPNKIIAIERKCRALDATNTYRVADGPTGELIAAIISHIASVKAPVSHQAILNGSLRQKGPEGEEDTSNENLPKKVSKKGGVGGPVALASGYENTYPLPNRPE